MSDGRMMAGGASGQYAIYDTSQLFDELLLGLDEIDDSYIYKTIVKLRKYADLYSVNYNNYTIKISIEVQYLI